MTLHQTLSLSLSRRAMLRSTAMIGAGAAVSGMPFPRAALAQISHSWPSVAAMMGEQMAGGKLANMVVGLGWGRDAPDYMSLGNTSFTSGIAVNSDTLYRLYSMTKPITGMAAMMCIDDGLLSLDQPLAEIIPAFANMQVQKAYDGAITADNLEPAARPITIRHMLTHTAGLGYNIVQQGPLSQAYKANGINPAIVTRLPVPGLGGGNTAASLNDFAEALAQLPLAYQPGTKWSYSVALDLMGRVIEVVTGKTFDGFLQERIFTPCGMDSTFFRLPASEQHRFTANYFDLGGQILPIDLADNSVFLDEPPFPFGGSGLISSARDYDRFLMMLANMGEIDGRRVMSEQAVRLGTSNLMPDTLAADGGFSFGGRDLDYGAGGLVGKGDAAGLYGWFGAASTAGLVNMTLGLRQTLMTQYMSVAQTSPFVAGFPELALRDALAQLNGQ